MVNYENADVRALYVRKGDERSVIAICDDRLIVHYSGKNTDLIKWYIPFENMYLLQNGAFMYKNIHDNRINYALINRISKMMGKNSVFIDKETGEQMPLNMVLAKIVKFYIVKMGNNAMDKLVSGLKFDEV